MSIDTKLEISLDFEKSVPGSKVSDACIQEIVERLRIKITDSESLIPQICVSDDSDNLLTKEADGCLRVQKATFCEEEQDIPVPAPVVGTGDKFIIPVTRFRIKSVILEGGTVIEIEGQGQTPGDPDTYPGDLEELKDNLEDDDNPFTWTIEGGQLIAEHDSGSTIVSVLEGGPDEEDTIINIDAIALEESQPGDVDIDFQECGVAGIDYTSQFLLHLDVTPGDGYERVYRTALENDRVRYKFEGVTKVLNAKLKVFTPASRESAEEF